MQHAEPVKLALAHLLATALTITNHSWHSLEMVTLLSAHKAPTVSRKIFRNVLLNRKSIYGSRLRPILAYWKIGFNSQKRNGVLSVIANLD